MADVFDATVLCDECNNKTEKTVLQKDNFRMRAWVCPSCRKQWLHPGDKAEYEYCARLRSKQFEVKLRMVWNSYAISIPREIIEFEEEMHRQMNNMIRLSLESPEKLSIFFARTTRVFKQPRQRADVPEEPASVEAEEFEEQ